MWESVHKIIILNLWPLLDYMLIQGLYRVIKIDSYLWVL